MPRFVFLFVVILMSFTATAQSREAICYTPSQFEAEQGLRIQSELMVIALTCIKAPGGGQAMYNKYQSFNSKNRGLISGYEAEMISFFRGNGLNASEAAINNFKTGLANDISQHAIRTSTAGFCKQFASRIDHALSMDQTKVRRWAQQVWPKSPTSRPLCKG